MGVFAGAGRLESSRQPFSPTEIHRMPVNETPPSDSSAKEMYRRAQRLHHTEPKNALPLYRAIVERFPESVEAGYSRTRIESIESPVFGTVAKEDTHGSSERILTQILHLQEKQQEALHDIQSKVGCLFWYMILGIVLAVVAALYGLNR